MVGSGFVILKHNTEIDMAISTWSRLARSEALSLSSRLSDYADLVCVLRDQRIARHSSHFNKTVIFT